MLSGGLDPYFLHVEFIENYGLQQTNKVSMYLKSSYGLTNLSGTLLILPECVL